jgi:hypothetical protein
MTYTVTVKRQGNKVCQVTVQADSAREACQKAEESIGQKPINGRADSEGHLIVNGWQGYCYEARRMT